MDDEHFDDSGDDYDTWEGRRRDALQEVSDALGVQFHRGGISWALPEDENSQFKGLRTGINAYDAMAVAGKNEASSADYQLMFDTRSESGHLHGVRLATSRDPRFPGITVNLMTRASEPRLEGTPRVHRFTTGINHISELGNVLREHDQGIPPPSPAVRAYNEAYEQRDLGIDSRRARADKAGTEVDPMMLPKVRKYIPGADSPDMDDFTRRHNFERIVDNQVDPQTGKVVHPDKDVTGWTTYGPHDFATSEDETVPTDIHLARLDEIHNEILGRSAQFHAASNDWQFRRMMKAEKALEDQKTDPRNPWGRL